MSRILYPIHTEPVSTSPETVTESRWHQPYSEPRRDGVAKAFAIALIASGSVISPWALTQKETVTEDRWHQPLSEPVRTRNFPVSEQQFLAYSKAAPYAETVSIDRWLLPLTEPVRIKPSLPAGEQQFLALVKAAPFPEPTTPDRWYAALAEPVRVKASLSAANQQALALIKGTPFPESVSIDRWQLPFSDPTRVRRPTDSLLPAFIPTQPAAAVPNILYLSLSEPVRVLSRLYALSPEQFYARFIDNPAPSMATWNEWWVDPVRSRPGLIAATQPDTTMPVIPIPTPPGPSGVYTVSGLYVIDQFTNNTVVYDYSGGVSHRTN